MISARRARMMASADASLGRLPASSPAAPVGTPRGQSSSCHQRDRGSALRSISTNVSLAATCEPL